MLLSVGAQPGPSCQATLKYPSVCVIVKLRCMRDLAPGAGTMVAASSGRPSRIRVCLLAMMALPIDRCTDQLTGKGEARKSRIRHKTVMPIAIVSHPSPFGPFDSQAWGVHEAAAGRRLAHNPLPRRSNEVPSLLLSLFHGSTSRAPPTLKGKALFRVQIQCSQRGRGNQTKHYHGTHDGNANRSTAAARIKPPPSGRGAKEGEREGRHLLLHPPFSRIQLPASCLADPQEPSRYVQTLFYISPAPEPLYPPQAPGGPSSLTTVHDECLVPLTHRSRWMEVIIAGS
ncbi:hypothetical protein ASPTUDRAFT_60684 [Aspergillus tubingensis CBS 134.48]|uniref:Uncharacterized protein n=1 Tax=Aspergillus tubingensis (strain CBS 134.48) TaxID=767770 RepID=A0A1L9NI36_ASPTC|nr:hypothetical protein ASPTUDRAFT_60684 [Aspergillus tubingensis CBS 134.48]